MLHFEGDKEFQLPAASLWGKLSDARFLVQCIPDVQSVSQAGPDAAAFTIRPGFSFVRGTLDVNLRVTEAIEQKSLRLHVASRGIGSTSALEAGFTLLPQSEHTEVHWTVDVTALGGLLKAVPQGLIKASAQKVIADVWASVEKNLAAP
jgi:carbon monoxide dehydrogenase subunit G